MDSSKSSVGLLLEAEKAIPRRRYMMLSLVLLATIVNYVDRSNLSIAASGVMRDLSLSPVKMGLLFSAFAWTYALANLPGGYIVDRLGSRLSMGLSLLTWSVATFLQGFAPGFASLFGLRMAVGVAEAPSFPANNRIVGTWFPKTERVTATAGFVMGQYLGPALAAPVLFWITLTFSWHAVFYVTGGAGMILAVLALAIYRDPKHDRKLSAAELDHIEQGGALVDVPKSKRTEWAQVRALFKHRQIWALCVGKFAVMSAQYFFLTWFPTYLIKARGLNLSTAGLLTMLPYLAASVGVVASGLWSDKLLRGGASMSLSRKLPIVTGFVLVATIFLANFTESTAIAIAILTFAYFAQGMSSTSWAMVSDIAPGHLIGTTGGLINFTGNLSGIVTPVTIGFIVARTGSFVWALGFVGIVALIGAFSYTFLMGPIHRLDLSPKASA